MIYAIGETIYDIIFRDESPVAARAGGAMLNTAVSLGRLGIPVTFISEYAHDAAGDIIDAFLQTNGVDTHLCYRYIDGKTTIALAFLNDRNDAGYSFYKLYPEKRLAISHTIFHPGDLILFGAFYSLMPEVRDQLIAYVYAARKAGALVLYDPNIRSPHKDEVTPLRKLIRENISLANIVRASDEDFLTAFGAKDGDEAYNIVRESGGKMLVYTKASAGVSIYQQGGRMELNVPPVDTVSTVGAGDTFNAGLIAMLVNHGITPNNIENVDENILKTVIETAIRFGSHACTHYDNYISPEFAKEFGRDG